MMAALKSSQTGRRIAHECSIVQSLTCQAEVSLSALEFEVMAVLLQATTLSILAVQVPPAGLYKGPKSG